MKFVVFLLVVVAGAFAAPSPRIFGGHDAQRGQFPFQVSIRACIFSTICSHSCGATIVSPTWVVTAAHCVSSSSWYSYTAIVGILRLTETSAERQDIQVLRTVSHPQYVDNGNVGPHDIALMKLSQSIRYNTVVQPARLPVENSEPSGQTQLSGWGSIGGTPNNPQMPQTLQTVQMPIIDIQRCRSTIAAMVQSNVNDVPLDNVGNVCTAPVSGRVSACSGDSGGPLSINNVLVGVVSWGISPCGSQGAPSVFVKMSRYLPFVRQHVDDLQIQ